MLTNVAFLTMAAIVMWKHKKRQIGKMEAKHVRSWLKALVSLAVIMGLTWIFGVLIVEVEALIPLAYIYTILVAFQGVFIFLLFVAFNKKVREDIIKIWRAKVKESELLNKIFKLNTTPSSQTVLSSSSRKRSLPTPPSK
jgi:uncharacterized protein YacL